MHTFAEKTDMLDYYDYIIIGAGIAGVKAAEAIRLHDVSGKILLVNGEDRLPYKRTSISKRLAAGFQMNALALNPFVWYDHQSIDLISGKVNQCLLSSKEIALHGKTIRWNKLILCTGSKPVEITSSTPDLSGLFYFRNAADVDLIRSQPIKNEHIAIIGGGVQGIELAQQMLLLGGKVSLIHHAYILMNRHFDDFMADHLLHLLKEKGVEVFLETKVKTIQKKQDNRFMVEMLHGEPINCDKIIVSIGTKPSSGLYREAGLRVGKGILVDQFLRTSHPDVFAAGDVAEHAGGLVTGLWHAAEMQGAIAGANATGQQQCFEKTVFRLKLNVFDQYYFSMNPQINNPEFKEVIIRKDEKYYRFFFNNDAVQGALMMNDKPNAKLLETAVREAWPTSMLMSNIN